MTEDNSRAKEFFRDGVRDYDRAHYEVSARSFMTDRNALLLRLLSELGSREHGPLLEAGCGPGHFLAEAWRHCSRIVAVDTSVQMLALSRSRLSSSALSVSRLAAGSIVELPFPDDYFEIVVTAGVIEYFQDGVAPLRELYRVLRPGGVALVPITNKLSPALLTSGLLDWMKRRRFVINAVNRVWTKSGRPPVRARHFPVRFETPRRHRSTLASVGFTIVAEHFFHLAALPHPMDRLAPAVTTRLLGATDLLLRTPLRLFAEGYLAVCRKG